MEVIKVQPVNQPFVLFADIKKQTLEEEEEEWKKKKISIASFVMKILRFNLIP